MERLRTYGKEPFDVVVVHGGPGAGGEMAPVARALADCRGVLEPIQTGNSVQAQIQELRMDIVRHGHPPVILVGFSWGAWLSMIVAARYPALVSELILIGSGPLEESYASKVHDTRMTRLTRREQQAFNEHLTSLVTADAKDRAEHLVRLGALTCKTDTYEPTADASDAGGDVLANADIFQSVWQEAAELRREGELLRIAENLRCPVLAIHGDYDPHPAEGVREPLARVIEDFEWVLLENCGHKPWREREARQTFFRVLEDSIC